MKQKLKNLWNYFTTYEKIWFISITVLAFAFAIIFPEEDFGGVNGKVIMALYGSKGLTTKMTKAHTIRNYPGLPDITGTDLADKLKHHLDVMGVEITEILICVVLSYRFATMATTLFFWIPIDIISFINWNRHKDREQEELTEVRRLTGKQEVLVLTGIVLWTVVVGYFLTTLEIEGLLSSTPTLETIVCYLDACASAVGIANGVFILLRYREQWIAWYICALLEAAINIISGQWVLLVLKAGYLTNTTYGYIKWTQYIKAHPKQPAALEPDRADNLV